MKSIAFSIQKGGTGKTSIAGNVASLISSTNRKVLLVDSDPQGSLSSWFLSNPPQHELSDVLQGKILLKDAVVELHAPLFILPTFGINGGLKAYADNQLEQEPFIFEEFKLEAQAIEFDFLVYDLSPAIGRLERSVLLGCDEVVTPLSPEYFSIDGIEIFQDFLRQIRKGFRKEILHEKIVLNLVNRSFRRHGIYRDKIKSLGYQVFEIGQDAKIPESQMMHTSLINYAPESKVIPELTRLAESLLPE